MVSFRMKLAGIPIQVHVLFASTMRFCSGYLTEEAPLAEVTVTQEQLEAERKRCTEEEKKEERTSAGYLDEYIETLALYRCILEQLFSHRVLLFHGSAVALNGKAYLFTARSGVGKTTHSRLWLKNIPGSYVLNGDKPLLLFREDAVYVCGTPWQGKENYGVNEMLPLQAICILERSAENRIEPVSFGEAMETLVTQAYCPVGGDGLVDFLRLVGRLEAVELFRLYCNMEDEAAILAYQTIAERKP